MNRTEPLSAFATRLREELRRSLPGPASPRRAAPPPGAVPPLPFDGLALELAGLQQRHNAPYRRLCEAKKWHADAARGWRDIPAVPAAAFKDFELTCLDAAERTAVFHSSGTTASRPGRHFHGVESLFLYECSLVPWFQRHLLPEWGAEPQFADFLALTPPPAAVPHSSLAHMFGVVQREFGHGTAVFAGMADAGGGWSLDLPLVLGHLGRASEARRPVVLLGTAFSFVHLLDALEEQGRRLELPAGSRVLETGGYKGRSRELPRAELHARLSRALGLPGAAIVTEYGMSELGSQAYDAIAGAADARDAAARTFHFPPWCRAAVVSPETGREAGEGETGLLRLCDLANVWSVAAIQTEDLAVRRGDGFTLLGRAPHAEPRGCSLMAVPAAAAP